MSKKERKQRKAKFLVLPDEQIQGPTVVICPVPMVEGGSLKGVREYTVMTRRSPEGDWLITVKEFDENDTGTVIRLPDGVAKAIYRHKDAITTKCRQAAGRKAFANRASKEVPAEIEVGNEA